VYFGQSTFLGWPHLQTRNAHRVILIFSNLTINGLFLVLRKQAKSFAYLTRIPESIIGNVMHQFFPLFVAFGDAVEQLAAINLQAEVGFGRGAYLVV